MDALQRELSAGLAMYWSAAGNILEGSGITLLDPVEDFFSVAKNFFSALFLYSYHRTAIPQPRRIETHRIPKKDHRRPISAKR